MTVYSTDVLVPNLELVPSSMSSANCCFLNCIQASQEAGHVVWCSHLFKNFPVCFEPYTVNETDVDGFLWGGIPLFFLLSNRCWQFDLLFLTFSKFSLYIWKFLVHVLLNLNCSLKDFERYLVSMWNNHNCVLVWAIFGVDLLWDWKENWPFTV